MEREFEQLTDREILASISSALDALTDDRLRLSTDAGQLGLLQDVVRLAGRLHGFEQQLAARVEKSQAVWNERRTSTRTWLAESMNLTPREAARIIRAGQG
ncbi:hypothetical protein, partial [Staphylococcus aureus]|uniref:hypothetical protein n=1 Tax=Staphylococcus aureus TaxID=1280 RepID=UPI003D20FBEA